MTRHPYTLAESAIPTLGLIVLQPDETIEHEFHRYFSPDAVKIHVSRIPSGQALTPDTIAQMEQALPDAARLLPTAAQFDIVGYACTSGTTLIGVENVHALIRGATSTKAVTDPLTAAIAAVKALGLNRIGIISPYIPAIAAPLKAAFEAEGMNVPDTLSFGEQVEARVARISPASIQEAAHILAKRTPIDGLFLSCTNLQTFDIIPLLEAELGLPVLSSNQVLAWHMARFGQGIRNGSSIGQLFAV